MSCLGRKKCTKYIGGQNFVVSAYAGTVLPVLCIPLKSPNLPTTKCSSDDKTGKIFWNWGLIALYHELFILRLYGILVTQYFINEIVKGWVKIEFMFMFTNSWNFQCLTVDFTISFEMTQLTPNLCLELMHFVCCT